MPRPFHILPFIVLVLMFGSSLRSSAQFYLGSQLTDTVRVTGGLSHPWEIELLNNDTALISGLTGDITLVELSTGHKSVIYTVPDLAQETQSGLMGMAIHPNYPADNKIYIASTYYGTSFNILFRVQYLTYNKATGMLENPVTIIDNIPSSQANIGGRIGIGPDMKLYVTTGDLGHSSNAQNTGNLHGKILRYNLDGSVPADNPFPGSPVYTVGHRNPQGFCSGTGKLYISEHGPFTNDEINILEPAGNYGWPLITGFCNSSNQQVCDSIDMVEPIKIWTPNIAPAGIAYYDHPAIPYLQNSLLVSALAGKAIVRLKLNTSGNAVVEASTHLINDPGRIRDIAVSNDGKMFFITSNTDLFGTPSPGDDVLYELSASFWTGTAPASEPDKLKLTRAGDKMLIEYADPGQIEWHIFSVDGRNIKSGISPEQKTTVLLSGMSPGVYIAKVTTGKYQQSVKFIIP